jgi:hypothetical protein
MFSQLSKPILGPKTHVECLLGTLKHENTLLVAIGRSKALFLKNSISPTQSNQSKTMLFPA